MSTEKPGQDTAVVQAKTSNKKVLTTPQDLFCGAIAGMTARMIIAPLDVLKIRFQVQAETRGLYQYNSMRSALRTIIEYEGVCALWKGNVPALLMVTPYASIQFATFYQLKTQNLFQLSGPYQYLVLGAISSSLATVFTYPLDLLRTRLAAQTEPRQYKNLSHAVRVIYGSQGIRGLYAGLQPTLFQIVPYISLHFTFYEIGKQLVMERTHKEHLTPTESLVIGAVSGTSSKFLTFPLDTAKKLMQVEGQFQSNMNSSQYRGIIHTLYSVWKLHGVRGWFRGIAPSLVKAAPNSAITFTTYEAGKRFFTESQSGS